MPVEADFNTPYFETPARTDRQQLLSHLARNTTSPVYLRAPAGAGKTRLMQRLRTQLQQETAVVWVDLTEPVKLMAAVIQQLGLPPEAADDWPTGLTQMLGTRKPLIVVDAADHLDSAARSSLAALADGDIPLILIGRGGGVDDWVVRFVDLPPLDAAESAAFLRGQAGIDAARITDEVAASAHQVAEGWPGGLMEVLHGLLSSPPPSPPAHRTSVEGPTVPTDRHRARKTNRIPGRRFPWAWIGAGVLGILLAAVLVFQDPINTLITPPEVPSSPRDGPIISPETPQPMAAPDSPPAPVVVTPLATAGDDHAADVQDLALPEPDRQVAPAETPAPPPAPGVSDSQPMTSDETDAQPEPAAASTVATDPLDDVMSDALAAAERSAQQPERREAAEELAPSAPVTETATPGAATSSGDGRSAQVAPTPGGVANAREDQAVVEAPPVTAEGSADRGASVPAPVEQRNGTAAVVIDRNPGARVLSEPVSGGPAPVVDRTAPGRVIDPKVTAEAAAKATVGTSGAQVAEGGEAWLRSRPQGHYTLQLIGGRDRASIEKFAKTNDVAPPYAIFRRTLDGADWFSLVAGEYPDRQAALAARERLPTSLRGSGVWPRTFESVRAAR